MTSLFEGNAGVPHRTCEVYAGETLVILPGAVASLEGAEGVGGRGNR